MKTWLSVKEVSEMWGIGMKKAYKLVNQPGFPSIRIGRKILVSYEDVKEWLASSEAENG